jgi:hypothetical protein
VRFILTGGNASDPKFAIPLLTGLDAGHVVADKAYDTYAILVKRPGFSGGSYL